MSRAWTHLLAGTVRGRRSARGPGIRTGLCMSGFTLIEITLGILVLAIATTTVLAALSEEGERIARAAERTTALRLARSLLEEVLAAEFEDPESQDGSFGKEEASRGSFDDVDDYHGWSSAPPVNALLLPVAGAAGFTRNVVVENVSAASLDTVVAAGSSPFKRVTVVVRGSFEELRLVGLRARR